MYTKSSDIYSGSLVSSPLDLQQRRRDAEAVAATDNIMPSMRLVDTNATGNGGDTVVEEKEIEEEELEISCSV